MSNVPEEDRPTTIRRIVPGADEPTVIRKNPDDEPTENHFYFFPDEHEAPTERIVPLYADEVPTEKIVPPPPPPPIAYPPPPPPLPPPPPQVYYPPPVPPVPPRPGLVDPRPYRRGRAGVAALALALFVAGLFLGFFAASLPSVQQFGGTEPVAKVSTKTATATATKTKVVTKTKTRTVTPPPPTATATKSVETTTVSQSCKTAMNAAERYMDLVRQGDATNNGRLSRLRREARSDFQYWSEQCRDNN